MGETLQETKAGKIVSVIIGLFSTGVLSICLSRRVLNVRDWSRLPLVCWLILIIYIDSVAFVWGTAIISNAYDVNSSKGICGKAILLCLGCYMTTKVFIYYFLVERAYLIKPNSKPRLKDKLYLFNSFGMLFPYMVVIALNFYFRFAIYDNKTCRIGMKRVAMIPLIGFDILVNVYLTTLFLIPLRSTYSYKTNPNSQVRSVALRTFIGSCCTLVSSVVNLTMVMVLNGEPGWICLMCCNIDILFSVLVLHWITSKDNASTIGFLQTTPQVHSPHTLSPKRPPHLHLSNPLPYPYSHEDDREYLESDVHWTNKPGITTLVTAKAEKDECTLERINSLPVGVVTVETEFGLREVVSLEGGEKSAGGGIGVAMGGRISEGDEEGDLGLGNGFGGTLGSEDDLFRKEKEEVVGGD